MRHIAARARGLAPRGDWVLATVLGLILLAGLVAILGTVRAAVQIGFLPVPTAHGFLVDELVFGFLTTLGNGPPLVVLLAALCAALVASGQTRSAAFVAASVIGSEQVDRILKAAYHAVRPETAARAAHLESAFAAAGVPLDVPTAMVAVVAAVAIVAGLLLPWRRGLIAGGVVALLAIGVNAVGNAILPLAPGYDSFPSGHAVTSGSLALDVAIVGWQSRRWRWPALVGAVLFALGVGLSRIYLGLHYPSDVVAGWCVAIGWTLVCYVAYTADRHPTPASARGPSVGGTC